MKNILNIRDKQGEKVMSLDGTKTVIKIFEKVRYHLTTEELAQIALILIRGLKRMEAEKENE